MSHPGPRRPRLLRDAAAAVALLACVLGAALGSARAGAVQVPIDLPLPARMDTAGVRTILITHFLTTDDPDVSVSAEMAKSIRRLLETKTGFRVLDVEPPNLPEQNLADLVRNKEYWQEMGRRYGADLILSGQIGFDAADQSGFVQESYVSPVTGQHIQRTRYAEREGFDLAFEILFFRGATGDLVYQDPFYEAVMFDGKGADHLDVLFQLFTRLEPEILGILTTHRRTEFRYLFTN